jgi:hypothetical protein
MINYLLYKYGRNYRGISKIVNKFRGSKIEHSVSDELNDIIHLMDS